MTGIRLLRHMLPPLPDRQWQVLDLRVRGVQAKEVSYLLGIDPKTVASYTNIIFGKFGVVSVVDLVHLCYAAGAIQFDESDRQKIAIDSHGQEKLVSTAMPFAAPPRSLRPVLAQLGADS